MVLFSIDTLRCIVTANKVRVIVPSGADTFVRYLEDYIGGTDLITCLNIKLTFVIYSMKYKYICYYILTL